MRAHIITLTELPESVEAAERAMASCRAGGLEAEIFPACARAEAQQRAESEGLEWTFADAHLTGDRLAHMGCTLSHRALWQHALTAPEPIIVLEHDAVLTGQLPIPFPEFWAVLNLGKPSWMPPPPWKYDGVIPLRTPTFRGTHAYAVNRRGAAMLLAGQERVGLWPVDEFMRGEFFPGSIQELVPAPFEAADAFSTISLKTEHKGPSYKNASHFWAKPEIPELPPPAWMADSEQTEAAEPDPTEESL
jgi:GR25 family glycosyltransferase involved in LPS biosynthesis